MDEEDFYQEDSFQDGQPIVQPGEAERRRILEDLRNLVGGEVFVDPVDPVLPHFSHRASAGHQRPNSTLRVEPVQGSSQARLAFNPQPSVSRRGAGSAPVVPPRNISGVGRRVSPPAGGQPPAGDFGPWFPRHLGEALLGRMDQFMDMVAGREE